MDRGLFDVLVWVEWLQSTGRMLPSEAKAFVEFFTLGAFSSMIDLVMYFEVDSGTALRREALVTMRTKPGRIMNPETIAQYNTAANSAKDKYEDRFNKITLINSTSLNVEETIMKTLDEVTAMIESTMSEQVLAIARSAINEDVLQPGFWQDQSKIDNVLQAIADHSEYVPRREVEENFNQLQPIVCLVLRENRHVFLLRRVEPNKEHRLHDQFVIWAGGHVRDEDHGDSALKTLENALTREIDEELRLRCNLDPKLVGVVYDKSKPRSEIHLGLVFYAEISSRDVSLSITQREFKERRGTSLSGKFLEIAEIAESSLDLEPWSAYIFNELGGSVKTPTQQGMM